MRKLTLAALSALALVGSAEAADLRGSKDTFEVPVAGTAVNWTGVYIGGQAGYSMTNHNSDLTISDGDEVFAGAFLDGIGSDGFFGGGTIGADIAKGHILFGIAASYNVSNSETEAGIYGYGYNIAGASIEEGDSWSATARIGYLFGSEKRALLYVLGGYGEVDHKYTVSLGDMSLSDEVTHTGWIVGAGAEYALANNIFLGIEGQYWILDSENTFQNELNGSGVALSDEPEVLKVMGTLKVKLNSGLFGY